jgi:hypothetical protein
MSLPHDVTTDVDPSLERIMRAVKVFRLMIDRKYLPLLRAVTGKRSLKVVPTNGRCSTDGKTVYLPVPPSLGDTLNHNKDVCGLRDEDLILKCDACRVLEDVDASVFHESAHMTYDSFSPVTITALTDAVRRWGNDEGFALPDGLHGMQLASALHPWLPMAANVVEDIHVNARLVAYRPGITETLRGSTRGVLRNGTDNIGGTSSWADAPLGARALMAAYLVGTGNADLVSELGDDVQHVASDDQVVDLMTRAVKAEFDTVDKRVAASGDLLQRLNELGFCLKDAPKPKPEPEDDEPGPEGDPSEDEPTDPKDGEESETPEGETDDEPGPGLGDEEGESDESEDSDEEGDSEGDPEASGDGTSDPGISAEELGDKDGEDGGEASAEGDADEGPEDTTEPAEEAGKGGSDGHSEDGAEDVEGDPEAALDGDPSPGGTEDLELAVELLKKLMGHDDDLDSPLDQDAEETDLVKIVLDQADYFDVPDPTMSKPRVGEPKVNSYTTELRHPVLPQHTSPSLGRLRVAFTQNRKTGMTGSLASGPKLDTAHLHRIAQEDYRIFSRRSVPNKRDWFVTIGMDLSGSTSRRGILDIEKSGVWALADMLARIGIPFQIFGHTGTHGDSYSTYRLVIEEVKLANEPWGYAAQKKLIGLVPQSANLDGHTLEYYRRATEAQKRSDNLIVYFTDGAMPLENHDAELKALQRNIVLCQRKGIHLVGVGIGTDSPKRHGLDTIRYDNLDHLPVLVEGLRERLSK